ncbi:MAG: hypothetical protein JWM27_4243 [Gemmatimonadetes bacterium]|nr:hypothetical protein [Gemmatimonadota bacterium]
MRRIPRPRAGEFPPYAAIYIDLLPDDGRVLEHLAANLRAAAELVAGLPDDALLHRYAPGKWTIKETLVHVVDDERIYACRALRFARGDATELPGFEQDDYAAASGANERGIESILAEYAAVRAATIALFAGLPEAAFVRSGVANGTAATVRALAYHIAGHELHHLNLIRDRSLGG